MTASTVTGSVRRWLRLEGAAALAFAVAAYWHGGHSWLLFAVLFLAPDLSFAAYLAGARAGAALYNTFHSYATVAALAALLLLGDVSLAIPLIWTAHIGLDRLVGYGLKYPDGFAHTHLGRIGRSRA